MYAYCNNNPVCLEDSSGGRSQVCIDNERNVMKMPWSDGNIGGKSAYSYIVHSFDPNLLISKMVADYVTNTDEQVVLDAEYLAFYKGCLVIRTNGTRSGSFGVLFIKRDMEGVDSPVDEIRHEYGHTVQLAKLGIVKYALCIGVPSLFEWGSDPEYYRRPWEITADIFGGVQSRSYPGYESAGFEYLENSEKIGIFVWATID